MGIDRPVAVQSQITLVSDCFLFSPFSNTVNLQVNPPYARDADNAPQRRFLSNCTYGQPLEKEEIRQAERYQKRQADGEEEAVKWPVDASGLRRDG